MDEDGPEQPRDEGLFNDVTETATEMAAAAARPPLPAELLAGRYRVNRLVGRGGMGEVYEAEDTELGGLVALKTVRLELSSHPSFLARFRREVQLARRVTHPNICRVFDVAYDPAFGNGLVFLTMEFLAGDTLSAELRRRGKLTSQEAAPLIQQIAAGLAALHELDIIHRDLKPGNVMLTSPPSGRVRAVITDFGLSRTVEDSQESGLSTTGFAGTPDYMSPEQLCGKELTPASDIYPLGLIMFEMITGRRTFAGGHAVQNAIQKVTSEVEPPAKFEPGLDPAWNALILSCLAKDPADRPSAAEIAETLKSDSSSRISKLSTARPARKNRRTSWILGAAGVIAAVALAAWLGSRQSSVPPASDSVATRITTDTGLSQDPALSRDGKMVAFSSDRAGGGDLDVWVQQIGGGAPIRLTQSGADETSPDFSADGTRIVYRSERGGGGIYAVSTFGGESTLLAAEGRNPKFSPDGRSIAYWTGREGESFAKGSARVVVLPASGGEARIVAPDFAVTQYPVWSPSGGALLCLARSQTSVDIDDSLDWYVVSLDGTPPRKIGIRKVLRAAKLLVPTTQIWWIPLAWLDSPSRLVFAAAAGDSTNLYQVKLREDFTVEGAPSRLTAGTAHEAQASFGAGAARMAYSSLRLNFDIWGVPLDAENGLATKPIRRLTTDESSEAFPSMSWDGSLLAFRSRVAAEYSLRVLNLRTEKSNVLLSGPTPIWEPRISGDGATITYRNSSDSIVQIPAQGGAGRVLCQDCGYPLDAGWDSRHILLEPNKLPDDVLVLDAATGKVSTMAPARQALQGARWSPDGRWVVFQEVRRDTNKMSVFITRAGTEPVPPEQWIAVTDGTFMDRAAAWSPSGNMLYFISDRDGFSCLYAMRLDPQTKRPRSGVIAVQHLHAPGRSLKFLLNRDQAIGLAVGRDLAVFTLGELTGNIWQRQ